MGVSEIRSTLFWGPYYLGCYIGDPCFRILPLIKASIFGVQSVVIPGPLRSPVIEGVGKGVVSSVERARRVFTAL